MHVGGADVIGYSLTQRGAEKKAKRKGVSPERRKLIL